MEKIFKTHRMGKAWEIDYYTFSIVRVLFSIRFSSCGILYHIENAWVSWSISHSMEKLQQNSLYGDNLWNWCSYFSVVWVLFSIKFPSYGILHHQGNKWVPPSVSHSIRKCSEIHRVGRACIGNHTFPKVWVFFFHQIPSNGILYHMRNTWLFPSICHSMRKCSKTHLASYQVAFSQHYFFCLFQNLVIP